MNKKPIIVVSGEPYSIFLEIFFKSRLKIKIKKPIILIASKELVTKQMLKLNFNFDINLINKNKIDFSLLSNKKINLIDVNFSFKKTFDKISSKSNSYIKRSFDIALRLLKENKCAGLINGPISKKHFLKGKTLGITEYLLKKTKANNAVMLIFNDKLSVSPITTHLALKDVTKNISMKKIYDNIIIIDRFYKKNFKKRAKIAITGLNPHCESNFNNSEENLIITPVIKKLKKKI